MSSTRSLLSVLVLLPLIAGGCSSLEYKVRESFGQQKRELLADRVDDARESQESAKVQFVSALEQFKAVTSFSGGDLEDKYDQLKAEYDGCARACSDQAPPCGGERCWMAKEFGRQLGRWHHDGDMPPMAEEICAAYEG